MLMKPFLSLSWRSGEPTWVVLYHLDEHHDDQTLMGLGLHETRDTAHDQRLKRMTALNTVNALVHATGLDRTQLSIATVHITRFYYCRKTNQ